MATLSPISTLLPAVINRLEEDATEPVFWSSQFELYTALVEAINEMMLLVGRPTQGVRIPYALQTNSAWQSIPYGTLLVTDIQGSSSRLRKLDLYSLDHVCSSWGPDWECDCTTDVPTEWAPIGVTLFAVHPVPTSPVTVTLTTIPYPATTGYPYDGTTLIPFHDEFWAALEAYAAHYARIKEGGVDFQESLPLYNDFLKAAQRLSIIEDRRDSRIFSPVFGAGRGMGGLGSPTQR